MLRLVLSLSLLTLSATAAPAETFTTGGDLFITGEDSAQTPPAGRDLFTAGFSVRLAAPVAEDAHLAGFSITTDAEIGGDLYAAGSNIRIGAPVGGDVSAMGFTVETGPEAELRGNARLAGGSVRVEGPVQGALIVTAGDVTLDAPIAGDVWIAANTVSFGDRASIGGRLHYTASAPAEIPESVIPASRVSYSEPDTDTVSEAARHWEDGMPKIGPTAFFASALTVLAFLMLLGLLFLALMPRQVEALRGAAAARPGMTVLFGVLGLSGLFGLIPVAVLTIIGIPLVPFILLGGLLVWTLGYLLGAYTLAVRVLDAFRPEAEAPGLGIRLLALFIGILIITLLNFVPFLGWMLNFLIMLLGVGAITAAITGAMLAKPEKAALPE